MNNVTGNRYQLFVLRHAKASDDLVGRDFDRLLTDAGIKQAEKIGDWMAVHELTADLVLVSPAKRALMTTDIVTEKLNIEPKKIQITNQIYEANLDSLLKVLASCPSQDYKVLLIGHNPSLEYLVDYLLSASITHELANNDRIFAATLVHLEMDVDWSHLAPYCAQLVSVTHGKFLP